MIRMLAGNEETVNAIKSSIGKEIKEITKEGETLHFVFVGGGILDVWDNGQSCCEHRYMVVNDKLSDFFGAKLKGFETKEAPPEPYDGGDHEVQFLDVHTSKGTFQVSSHNEHNGYYGGFSIEARASV